MNPAVLARYAPLFAQAALVTLQIAVIGIAAALVIGLAAALARQARVPVLSQLATGYVEVSRNTPLIVQLFFIYFGLPKAGIVLSGTTSAVLGLAFLGGGYMTEAFRSGLDSVGRIQFESAASLALSPAATLRYVVVPQALSRAMPALVANTIFLIKETSVVSVVALPDLVFRAKSLIGSDYNTAEALMLLVVFYLLILLPVSLGGRWLEGRVRHAEFGV